MPPQPPPHAALHDIEQHWQSVLLWLWPGSARPMTAPLAVHSTMLPPEAKVAA
jgi:hypothetical protein